MSLPPMLLRGALARISWVAAIALGCKVAPVEPTVTPEPAPSTPTAPSDSAFVVVLEQTTLVIPVDPDREPVRLPGRWVGTLPAGLVEVEVDAPAPSAPEEHEEDCDPQALVPELEPISIVGGMLYEAGMSWNGACSGVNLYDGASETTPLRPDAVEPKVAFPGPSVCKPVGMSSLGFEDIELPDAPSDQRDHAQPCNPEEADEMIAYRIDRGHLLRITGAIGVVGDECSCVTAVPVSPRLCPSPLDPCGTAEGFDGLADADEFWVSTDGRFALAATASRLSLRARDEDVPRQELEWSGRILGVELHPHAALQTAREVAPDATPDPLP